MHQKFSVTLREEPFGYTKFDNATMKHCCISRDEAAAVTDAEMLPMPHGNVRPDVLFSPIRIYFELTLKCNLRCKYCYNSSGVARPNELTTDEVKQALSHLRNRNVLDIRFTGGEFTLRDDWYEIFRHAKDLGFAVSCNTNAARYSEDTIKKLVALDLNQITISLDGYRDCHESNRGKGTFDSTLENIKELHRLGARLRFNTLVTKYSAKDVEFLLETAGDNAEEINFFTVAYIGRGKELAETDGITVQDHLRMSDAIQKLKPKYPELNVLHFEEVTRMTAITKEESEKFGLKRGYPPGTTTFNILSDGSYACGGYSCYIDENLALGNVKIDDIHEVWQNSKMLEEIRNDSLMLINTCEFCTKANMCQGAKYEVELYRLQHPEAVNQTCEYGKQASLLSPKLLPYRHGVGCVTSSGNKFLLIRMREWPENVWRFPQGGVEPGETEIAAVHRELYEELGQDQVIVTNQYDKPVVCDWHYETILRNGHRWRGQKLYLYRVNLSPEATIRLDVNELDAYRWCGRNEIAKLTHSAHPDFLGYSEAIEDFLNQVEQDRG